MRVRTVVTPTRAKFMIVLLAGALAALVIATGVMASGPADEGSSATPTATPTPERPVLPNPPPKLHLVEGPATTALPQAPAPDQGTVYTWEDEDTTLRVVAQEGLRVQNPQDTTVDDEIVARDGTTDIVRRQAGDNEEAHPIFRSESGGGLMTLPGGVLLALDPAWDQDAVERFFSINGIPPDRRSNLGFMKNGFLIATAPGFPSLELANVLATQQGVMSSSPNWWTELQAK